jgi:hypothetical protein
MFPFDEEVLESIVNTIAILSFTVTAIIVSLAVFLYCKYWR